MPLYMDVHNLDGAVSVDDVAKAHLADLEKQGAHDVSYLRYWVNEPEGKIFCLVEAPSAEAANTVHREAHGLVADDPGVVPGRDVERVPGGEVCRRAVLELDTDRAGEDVAGVRDLARRRARERAHVVRPAPAGPQLHQGDGGLPDGDDPVGAVGVLPRPVGTLQALARDRHGSRR